MAYVTPSTTTVGAIGKSADYNIVVDDVIYLKGETDKLPVVTQTKLTSRAFNTVYQHTGTKIRIINAVIGSVSNGDNVGIFCDTSTAPTTQVAYIGCDLGTVSFQGTLHFVAAPNDYWKASANGTPTLDYTVEWDLH